MEQVVLSSQQYPCIYFWERQPLGIRSLVLYSAGVMMVTIAKRRESKADELKTKLEQEQQAKETDNNPLIEEQGTELELSSQDEQFVLKK